MRQRNIDQVRDIVTAQGLKAFADPVRDHNGIVQRVPDHSQHRGEHREVERHLGQGEKPEHNQHIVYQGDHGADGKLKLETKGDIEHHQAQGDQHADAALVGQFFTDLRADKFVAAQADVVAHGLHQAENFLTQSRVVVFLHADEHIGVIAEILRRDIFVARIDQGRADQFNIHTAFKAQFNLRATGEIEAEIEAAGRQR